MSTATAAPDQQHDTDGQSLNAAPAKRPRKLPLYMVAPPEEEGPWERAKNTAFPVVVVLFVVFWGYLVFFVGSTPSTPDFTVTGMTFHTQGAVAQRIATDSTVACFSESRPFEIWVTVRKSGGSGSYYGPAQNRPHVRVVGRPLNGGPEEVIEASVPLTMTGKFTAQDMYVLTPQIPPSFAGRNIVWTATAWHPRDPRRHNDTRTNVTLRACGA